MLQPFLTMLAVFSAAYIALLFLAHRGQVAHSDRLTEFFVAGRGLGLWSAIATLGATEIGLITIAYNAQKGFNTGFAVFHIGIAAFVGCLLVGLTGFIVSPLRKTGVLTIPEFYEQRYGRDVRVIGALVMALGGILNMGLFLKVASTFIVAMLAPAGVDIGINAVMVSLIAVAVSYTCFGGMRSVVVTDIIQFILLAIGLLVAVFFAMSIVPAGQAIDIVSSKMGSAGFNPFEEKSFGPAYVLWMVFVAGVVSSAIWPTALTRALLIKRQEDVAKTYLISSVIFMGRMILPAFLGVLAYAYFNGAGAEELPALASKYGDDFDLAAMPAFLGIIFPAWLLAAMSVAMFASFMSTQDSYLFCWASVLARDVYAVLRGRTHDADAQINVTRIVIVLIALYELYWGLIYEGKEDIWDYLAVSGSIYFCSGTVLLAGGLYWKGASWWGALLALFFGFSALLGLSPVKAALGLDAVSAPAIGFISIALSALGFVIGSLLETSLQARRA